MFENEFYVKPRENGIISANVNDLPRIISSQIDAISELESRVAASDESAKRAMSYVYGQMSRYEEKGRGIFKHRAGNTKDIIEDTQEAIEHLAEAQQVTVEALEKSFDFQRKLSEVSKYLFLLGCTNIAANRVSVRTIEAKLRGASSSQISELAKQELLSVVRQLKAKEDILIKQDELKAKVKNNWERLNEKDKIDVEQSQRLEELGALLENKDNIDKRQEESIAANKSEIDTIKSALNEKDSLDNEQNQRLKNAEEAIKILYDYMKTKDALDKTQSNEIEKIKKVEYHKTGKMTAIIAIILSTIAICASTLSIFSKFLNIDIFNF